MSDDLVNETNDDDDDEEVAIGVVAAKPKIEGGVLKSRLDDSGSFDNDTGGSPVDPGIDSEFGDPLGGRNGRERDRDRGEGNKKGSGDGGRQWPGSIELKAVSFEADLSVYRTLNASLRAMMSDEK